MPTLYPDSTQEPGEPEESTGVSPTPKPLPSSPHFLTTLQPPPLPDWAAPHASTALMASRLSLNVAVTSSAVGFRLARAGTKFGFNVARTFLNPLLTGAGAVLDHTLGLEGVTGGGIGGGPVVLGLKSVLDGAEYLAMFGISVGSEITKATLSTADSTVASLEAVYGNDEALRALGAFLQLVKAEYTTSLPTDPYPEGGLSVWSNVQVVKAAATWGALQSVTGKLYGARLAPELTEIDVERWGSRHGEAEDEAEDERREIVWEITEEQVLEGGEEVIEASVSGAGDGTSRRHKGQTEQERTRDDLKRFSKLCLGSYGGIGSIFFNVKLPGSSTPSAASSSTPLTLDALRKLDEDSLGDAFRRSKGSDIPGSVLVDEQLGNLESGWTATGSGEVLANLVPAMDDGTAEESLRDEMNREISETEVGSKDYGLSSGKKPKSEGAFTLWGLLSGNHDVNVLEHLGGLVPGSARTDTHAEQDMDSSDDGEDLTDDEKTIPVVHAASGLSTTYKARKGDGERAEKRRLREARKVEREQAKRKEKKGRRPPRFFVITDHESNAVIVALRGTLSVDDVATDLACETAHFDETLYWDPTAPPTEPLIESAKLSRGFAVHGGMWEVALAMGGPTQPLTRAVAKALRNNPTYDLFLVGHSLGAGVAAMLSIIWANPDTCLTTTRSGLPIGRKVKCYGFAPPCTTDAALSARCKTLIHSWCYGSDAVPRFSLGCIKDIRSAAAWLCYANENPEESCNNILSRIIAYKRGKLDHDPVAKLEEETWFGALRTTLEANMVYADLFPPGDTYWLVPAGDLELPNDVPDAIATEPRLFRVTGRADVVWGQMLFTRTMLSSHLPHHYMQSIADFL